MTYPEQLKQMSNEELLEKFAQYHSRASWDSYRLRMSKTELLRRIELKDETLKQQYQKGWESRGEEAMKRVKTRPIKNKNEIENILQPSQEQPEGKTSWQSRYEMGTPTNPLQELHEILTRQSRDMSEDRMIACIYGIIVGWDDASYEELKQRHNWTDDNIKWQKLWHKKYKKAWDLYMSQPSQEHLKEALEEIISPIKFMKKKLKECEKLNGEMACALSDSANYLKEIATKALNQK